MSTPLHPWETYLEHLQRAQADQTLPHQVTLTPLPERIRLLPLVPLGEYKPPAPEDVSVEDVATPEENAQPWDDEAPTTVRARGAVPTAPLDGCDSTAILLTDADVEVVDCCCGGQGRTLPEGYIPPGHYWEPYVQRVVRCPCNPA